MSIRAISPYYFIRSSVQPLKRNVCVLPQSHKLHHAYMPISRKNTTSITSYIAILNRTYASTPSAVQLQKHNGEQGVESDAPSNTQINKDQAPAYDLTFTCKKCLSRSTHRVSKQGFYKGTVLITCSGCKNRHLISDHLKVGLHDRALILYLSPSS